MRMGGRGDGDLRLQAFELGYQVPVRIDVMLPGPVDGSIDCRMERRLVLTKQLRGVEQAEDHAKQEQQQTRSQ